MLFYLAVDKRDLKEIKIKHATEHSLFYFVKYFNIILFCKLF